MLFCKIYLNTVNDDHRLLTSSRSFSLIPIVVRSQKSDKQPQIALVPQSKEDPEKNERKELVRKSAKIVYDTYIPEQQSKQQKESKTIASKMSEQANKIGRKIRHVRPAVQSYNTENKTNTHIKTPLNTRSTRGTQSQSTLLHRNTDKTYKNNVAQTTVSRRYLSLSQLVKGKKEKKLEKLHTKAPLAKQPELSLIHI